MRGSVSFCLCLLAVGCSGEPPADLAPAADGGSLPTPGDAGPPGEDPEIYFPPADDAWEAVEPTSIGWDPARLEAAVRFAGEHASRAFLLLHDGRILAERYWSADESYAREIASAQKSVVSILAGMTIDAGRLSFEDPVLDHLGAGWTFATPEQEAAITLRHLLEMTSGLDIQFAYRADPGTEWLYNTSAYQQVRRVLEAVWSTDIEALTQSLLWQRIGVRSSHWRERRLMQDPKGHPLYGLEMTARDMGRFGLLVLAGGRWGSEQIVDPSYLAQALSTSQALNPSYGLLWWLNGKDFALLPGRSTRVEGPLVPDAPLDAVAALGKDDQKIYVCRTDRLVMVRLGAQASSVGADALSDFDTQLWAQILAARN